MHRSRILKQFAVILTMHMWLASTEDLYLNYAFTWHSRLQKSSGAMSHLHQRKGLSLVRAKYKRVCLMLICKPLKSCKVDRAVTHFMRDVTSQSPCPLLTSSWPLQRKGSKSRTEGRCNENPGSVGANPFSQRALVRNTSPPIPHKQLLFNRRSAAARNVRVSKVEAQQYTNCMVTAASRSPLGVNCSEIITGYCW